MSDFDYEIKEEVSIEPLPDVVLVHNMEYGERKSKIGLIIPDDNGKEVGIRPRYCTAYAVGKNIEGISIGDKLLVAHGRWTRGIRIKLDDGSSTVIRRVDPKDILLVFDQ